MQKSIYCFTPVAQVLLIKDVIYTIAKISLNRFQKSKGVPSGPVVYSSCMHAYKLWTLMMHSHKHTQEQMSLNR